jgi:hypothetical protein
MLRRRGFKVGVTIAAGLLALSLFAGEGTMADIHFPVAAELPAQRGLPDPLLLSNGQHVMTRKQWVDERRPQLKALFQHYMVGHTPPAPHQVTATLEREDLHCFGGKAAKKEIALTVGPPGCPKIHLLLVVPNVRKHPAPAFLGMNFCGNHALLRDPTVALPTVWMYGDYPGVQNHRATEAGRGSQIDVWAIEQSIDQGYAVATFYDGDIDPDRPDVREGIQPYFRDPAYDWGTIAAWAWGLQRAIDYVVTDSAIDKDRIAVVGHSRLGKAALLAAAFDERIALVIPHQAGCGGSAPSRGKTGESVKQINERFPHWFNARFKEFNEQPERLPFDQHELVALVAPRPVLFSNAVEDTWANPAGQFEVLQAADPVYRFLGVDGLGAQQMPVPGQCVDSRLGYSLRLGKHSMGKADWIVFLHFADKHLGAPHATHRDARGVRSGLPQALHGGP